MKWFLLVSCGFAAIFLTTDARSLGDETGRCNETRSWMEDCNRCSCTKGYFPFCTLMGCDASLKYPLNSTTCEPNQLIHQDCNKCRCNSEGTQLICTKRACLSGSPDDVSQINEEVNVRQLCEPNEPFDKECNRCVCNDDGSSFTCTQNFCADDLPNDVEVFNNTEASDHSERQKVCLPNENFKRDCNTCKCNQDGTDFSCTRKFCLEMENVEVMQKDQGDVAATFHALVCSPNESFEKNCNKCRCNRMGTGYSCTSKDCGKSSVSGDMEAVEYSKQAKKSPPKTQQKCEPRSVFKLDCNTCQCSDDGTTYYCTRRVCLPEVPEENDENVPDHKSEIFKAEDSREKRDVPEAKFENGLRSCNAGEEFRLDCNTCLCNDEGKDYSCSRNDCQKQSVSKRSVESDGVEPCVPGTTFKRDCNTCRCLPNGRNVACTLMLCVEPPKEKEASQDIESASERVCTPGESTTRDCNSCVCSDDGKKLNCTRNSCSNEDDLKKKQIDADDSDFRCTPGDQFKRECNDCTCSANGKSVFCTLKLCV